MICSCQPKTFHSILGLSETFLCSEARAGALALSLGAAEDGNKTLLEPMEVYLIAVELQSLFSALYISEREQEHGGGGCPFEEVPYRRTGRKIQEILL